jgi:hypothetical protein
MSVRQATIEASKSDVAGIRNPSQKVPRRRHSWGGDGAACRGKVGRNKATILTSCFVRVMQITLDKNKLTDFTPSGGNTADFQFSLTITPLGHHGGRLPSGNRRLGATLLNLPAHAHNALGKPASSTMCRSGPKLGHGQNRWRRRKKSRPNGKPGTKVLSFTGSYPFRTLAHSPSGGTSSRASRAEVGDRCERNDLVRRCPPRTSS